MKRERAATCVLSVRGQWRVFLLFLPRCVWWQQPVKCRCYFILQHTFHLNELTKDTNAPPRKVHRLPVQFECSIIAMHALIFSLLHMSTLDVFEMQTSATVGVYGRLELQCWRD
jgi:hypothetical protein